MVNVLTLAQDIVTEFLPTLASLFNEFFALTFEDALRGIRIPEYTIDLLDWLGVPLDTSLMGFLIGTGLVVVLIYNLAKWLVGIVTGS